MPQQVLDIILRTLKEGDGAEQEGSALNGVVGSLTELQSGYMLVSEVASQAMQIIQGAYDATITKTQEYDGEVRQMELVTGDNASQAARMIQVAEQMGVSYDQLTTSMKFAVKQGIEPNIQGLEDVSQKFLSLESPIDRDKLLLKDFGKSGEDMAAEMMLGKDGLQQLNDSVEAGLIPTQDAINASKLLSISENDLKESWDAIAYAGSNTLIPAIQQVVWGIQLMTNFEKESWSQGNYLADLWGVMSGKAIDLAYAETEHQISIDQLKMSTDQLTDGIDANGNATQVMAAKIGGAVGAEGALETAQKNLAAAQAKLTTDQDNWNSGTGSKFASLIEQHVTGTQNQERALAIVDGQFHTNTLSTKEMSDQMSVLVANYAKTGDMDAFASGVSNISSQFQNTDTQIKNAETDVSTLQKQLEILTKNPYIVHVVYSQSGAPGKSGGMSGTENNPQKDNAFGTGPEGYIVPADYPGDSWPVYAQSGEQVIVKTAADQQAGSGGGDIHLHNYGVINITPQTEDMFQSLLDAFR
ncbi:MAG: hypothetical protein P4L50_24665 [Anaerolineaceae bacterium]|nr:hypothetical protein [Anaerolineaceae bacterium]